jgi:hypothetical protein
VASTRRLAPQFFAPSGRAGWGRDTRPARKGQRGGMKSRACGWWFPNLPPPVRTGCCTIPAKGRGILAACRRVVQVTGPRTSGRRERRCSPTLAVGRFRIDGRDGDTANSPEALADQRRGSTHALGELPSWPVFLTHSTAGVEDACQQQPSCRTVLSQSPSSAPVRDRWGGKCAPCHAEQAPAFLPLDAKTGKTASA